MGSLRDARKTGLLGNGRIGVVVGKWIESRRYLTFSGPEHHLITGASCAGKWVNTVSQSTPARSLQGITDWMAVNGEGIYSTRP